MKDKKRIKRIIKIIETYWDKHPDQRFGQMLINLGICADDIRLWNNQDEVLEEYLKLNFGEEENE